ncbi:MAG: hypothetical protein RIC14_17180 [Filomicrobium sp.]
MAALLVAALMAVIEWSSPVPAEKDLRVVAGTLIDVPMERLEVRRGTIKTYKVLVRGPTGFVHELVAHGNLVTAEKYYSYIRRPVTAKVSETNYIYVLEVNGQELISYEQMSKMSAHRLEEAYDLPIYFALVGLLFLALGYFLPQSRTA